MSNEYSELAQALRVAIEASALSIDDIAERTKVPRTTIQALIEEPITAVSPGRVYMRGHLKVIARALKLDVDALVESFDRVYPLAVAANDTHEDPTHPLRRVAVSAGLYGIAVVAVVVAFATVLS